MKFSLISSLKKFPKDLFGGFQICEFVSELNHAKNNVDFLHPLKYVLIRRRILIFHQTNALKKFLKNTMPKISDAR